MNDFSDDSLASLRPRAVFVELRGPAEEVAKVKAWIEERALYSNTAIVSVFGDKVTYNMDIVVDEE